MINATIKDRAVSIGTAVLVHALLLFFVVFTVKTVTSAAAERLEVMKITNIEEELPKLPPSFLSTTEKVAEVMVESDDVVTGETYAGGGDAINFLPMHLVSELPRFSEDELRRRVIYPPIAQRSEVEGTVYLEVFVDREGFVRNVTILREDPPDRGFGEAAVRAFTGRRGTPAQANGEPVSCRFQKPVTFILR